MDDSLARNLDTQHRRLAEIEQHLDALLSGDTAADLPAEVGAPETYVQLTTTNDAIRADRGWETIDLDAALTPEALANFDQWRQRRRTPWQLDDILAVAVAGAIGIAATWYDTTIDDAVRAKLKLFKNTDLIKRWEDSAKRMSIDYMGPGFGGKLHHVRSAGHDIGRPFEALRQIRRGEFHGFYWEDAIRHEVHKDRYLGASYRPVEDLSEALVLWGKHLVADFVGDTNLPLPGWTKLYELDNRYLRQFAHQTYGAGVNLRSFALSTLPVMTTEIVIRTHVHGRAMVTRGSAMLQSGESALRAELLLAGHSLVGAAALGKAITRSMNAPALPAAARHAKAFRHINWPVLMMIATRSLDVARDARARHSTAASWDDLLADLAAPWQLDEAVLLDSAIDASGG
jgi:hypothetical protein